MKISIGICAYNEQENIGNLLNNVLNQPFSSSHELSEIIIVCSGCIDNTEKIVKKFQKTDKRVKLISEKNRRGKSVAQNRLIEAATGDAIVFLSADTFPAKGSILKLVQALNGNIGCVGAEVIAVNDSASLADFISRFTWKIHNHTLVQENENETLGHLAGDMFAVKQGILDKIPPDVVNDDAYMVMEVKSKGFRVKYVSESVCYLLGPRTINDYLRQRRRVLFGHMQLTKLLGEAPPVLKTILYQKPLEAVHIILTLFKTMPPKDISRLPAVVVVELAATSLARWDNFNDKTNHHILWERVNTTKTLVTEKST